MKSLGVPFILIGGVNDDGDRGLIRRLAGAFLLNYDAVEGTGAVIPCRLYIESAGSETDEEFGSGFQCRLFSLAVRRPATTGATMGVTMVAETATLVAGVLLLDYDAVEGMQNRKTDEEVDGINCEKRELTNYFQCFLLEPSSPQKICSG